MELNELRYQAAQEYTQEFTGTETFIIGVQHDFISGAVWEFERDKWHNAGGELPPKSPGGRCSERVLVEYKNGDISAIRYDHGTNKWRTDKQVIKWTFIP